MLQLLASRPRPRDASRPRRLGVAGFSRPLRFLLARSRQARVLPEALPQTPRLRADPALASSLIASGKDRKLQASTAWSAPEEISACYGSSTGHEPSTERKQRFERPADGGLWDIDDLGLRVAERARAGPASIPVRRRRSLRGLPQHCGGLRRSRDPFGSDRAGPGRWSPAQTLRLRRAQHNAAAERDDARRRTRE